MPVIVTEVELVAETVVIANVAFCAPAATLTLAGAVAAAELLLVNVTTAPPVGAALVNVTVPCEELPPTTVLGLTVRADNVRETEVAACGVKLRVADQDPATPAELTPRTLHHSLRAGSVPAVNLEMLTFMFTTNGEAKLFESSI